MDPCAVAARTGSGPSVGALSRPHISPPTLQESDSSEWRGLGAQYSRTQAQRCVTGLCCGLNVTLTQAPLGADQQSDAGRRAACRDVVCPRVQHKFSLGYGRGQPGVERLQGMNNRWPVAAALFAGTDGNLLPVQDFFVRPIAGQLNPGMFTRQWGQ
jgi:hypothetical protein